jgi:hypothetical protein
MGYIELKGLDFIKMRNWIKSARDKQINDPVFSFISAWIGFNYYYSTFAIEHKKEFSSWAKKNFSGYEGNKSQWSFLVNHKIFKAFFSNYRINNKSLLEAEIYLPIKNIISGDQVPSSTKGKYKLKDLDDEQIFSVIYQIRNNLFHGNKDPMKNKRDKKLSTLASDFMVSFLTTLINNTDGEVIQANESF